MADRARIQTFRSTSKGVRPIAGDEPLPGEVYANYADRQLGIMSSDASAAIDLVAIRFFSTASDYAIGDYVVQAGTLYRCTTAVTAGAFNGASWTAVGSGGGGGVTDGDKGDIVVSASGATWMFDTAVVTATAKTLLDDTTTTAMRTTLGAAATAHTHSQADVTNLVSDLAAKAPLASPGLTGTPTAPTATAGTNTTQIATTGFVATSYAPLASPALTGTPTAPTPTAGTNDTKLATTAFVTAAVAAGAGGGIVDGDKGDVVVSGSGTVWTFDTAVVTSTAKTLLDDTSVGAMRTTLGAYPTTGGTITGNVTIAPPAVMAEFSIDDPQALSASNASIFNWKRNTKNRWAMFLDVAEPGSGMAGSNWTVARYKDDGTFQDVPFKVLRTNGEVQVLSTFAVTGSSVLTGQLTLGATAPFVAPYIYNNVGGASANMVVASNGVVNKISSMRVLKKDIAPVEDAAGDAVLALKPSTFRFRNDPEGFLHYGFIADELATADACFATWDFEPDRDANGELVLTAEGGVTLSAAVVPNGVDSNAIIAALVNLVQRMDARIKALEADR